MKPPPSPLLPNARVAYFSMEIALTPEIHTYSGGLGVLAGDTVRSCADLALPVVFVTLASRSGYLHQEIDADGRSVERPDPWDPGQHTRLLGAKIAVEIEGRTVWVQSWLYNWVGGTGAEVPVLFLDTDVAENAPEDRLISDRLYGGDVLYRLKQEIVLGIGGIRMLRALDFDVRMHHMNEGHSAFLGLELLHRGRIGRNGGAAAWLYDLERVRARCIFTTHTPIEAGHDRFSYDLVEKTIDRSYDLDLLKRLAGTDELNMTRLALNLSSFVNGVAKRHAETSRHMFPGYHVHAVTNGVHAAAWVAPALSNLLTEMIPDWQHEQEMLLRADQLPDDRLWQAHDEAKGALIRRVAELTGVVLDRHQPILGFARRMTGYKRPDLLFTSLERLQAIERKRPFQVVVAGKAHPRDVRGHELIERIHADAKKLGGRPQVVFLPNYDLALARLLVAGVDVWLNTPLPPYEASGTSGMKAALNGVLNLSVLDGWWVEGWIEGRTGWAIGDGSADPEARDDESLYAKLEEVVLPLFYDNRTQWLWMMKESIGRVGSYFNSHRMMRRYASEAYLR